MEDDGICSIPTYSSTPFWKDLIRFRKIHILHRKSSLATRYLLVPQARGDKSAYLALAGYTLDNFTTLLTDLRAQILNHDAAALETSSYGQLYEIRAPLVGPSGRTLRVRTIWMTEYLSGVTKFITLIPD
jgi:hypothetical protein